VCTVDELETNKAFRVVLEKKAIVIVKDAAGTVHAIGDTCTHGDISLAEGFVEEDGIECWAHGSMFSLTTGKPLNLPAYEPVPVFVVHIDADGVISIDPNETLAVQA
jgi:3-phenylpropionate/trans-cinnamate dioxygenase ferredoxin subunit